MNWNKYSNTLDFLEIKIKYYEYELIKYLKHIINPNNKNTTDKDILELNAAIFTYFNNIPDVFHPLTENLYFNYIAYISYINPKYFNIKSSNDIVRYKYLLKKQYFEDKRIVIQDIAPYNKFKRFISINIKYFNINNYTNEYVILVYTNKKNKYILYSKDDINNIQSNEDIVYVNILRPIKIDDIDKVFTYDTVKKNTKIYAYHSKLTTDINWFSIDNNILLNDPYKIFYKKGDILYKYTYSIDKTIKVINLSKNIFLRGNSNLDDLIYNKSKNKIYNGFINYIKYYDNHDYIWNKNRGKRLLHEIIYKNSNIIFKYDYYYIHFLQKYNIHMIKYTFGFYEKLNKYYPYEIGIMKFPNYIKHIKTEEYIVPD
jgi:hypothetical protein